MKIYITGVSGTGKSSIARSLRTKGIVAIDIDDDLSKWIHKVTGQSVEWEPGMSDEWYEFHGWRCDIEKLKQLLSENKNIVVVGAAANQEDYLSLFDKIYFLQATPETIVARITARSDNDFGKHPAEQARLLDWQKTYVQEMKDKGAIQLDAEKPLEELVEIVASNFV